MRHHFLTCGCHTCGCICAEHSKSGAPELCAPHTIVAVSAFIGWEATRLVAIGMFIAMVLAVAAVIR